jgi:hypothetical protein
MGRGTKHISHKAPIAAVGCAERKGHEQSKNGHQLGESPIMPSIDAGALDEHSFISVQNPEDSTSEDGGEHGGTGVQMNVASGNVTEGGSASARARQRVAKQDDHGGFTYSSFTWDPDRLDRKTWSADTRRAVVRHHPDFEGAVARFIHAVVVSPTLDRDTGFPMVPWQMLEWVIGEPFTTHGGEYWNGERVLHHLRRNTSLGHAGPEPVLTWKEYEPRERCRAIICDGVHPAAKRAIEQDLSADVSRAPERVYVVIGEQMHSRHPEKAREKWEALLADEPDNARADTTRQVLRHMNGMHPRTQAKVKNHIPEAIERVKTRPYDVELSPFRLSYDVRDDQVERIQGIQRRFDLSVLQAIGLQHKQFYQTSSRGYTDRIFPANKSVLYLPSDVREILCQDYFNVDLKSAHLNIAAWLWEAESAQALLQESSYSVWDHLMEHYGPLIRERYGDPTPPTELRKVLKGCFKIALYSVVFGMPETNVKAKLTENLSDWLPCDSSQRPSPGNHFGQHPLIRSLLDARDRQAEHVISNEGMETADGGWIPIGPRVDLALEEGRPSPLKAAAAKVLGTVAQSYEMELMSVLVDYEQEREARTARNYFKIAFWLHDGAYVQARSISARMKDLDERLQRKADELGVLARFDYESIDPEQ